MGSVLRSRLIEDLRIRNYSSFSTFCLVVSCTSETHGSTLTNASPSLLPTAPPIRRVENVTTITSFLLCLRLPTQASSARALPLFAYSETRPQRSTIPIAIP